jgi:predicted GNAT family acetyltransferase
MRVIEEQSADRLWPEAEALFSQREVENNGVLGILQAICNGQFREPAPWLWGVRDGDQLLGVALRTPPLALNLSTMPPAACDALAGALIERRLLPLALMGSREEVDCVVAGLARRTRVEADVITELRQFELREVSPAPAVSGAMRVASDHDLALLISMLNAFEREATPSEAGKRDLRAVAVRMISRATAFVWDDGGVCVAFAAWQRRVGRGVSIGPVYTPPALRGRGYATALVAALSQHMLDSGCAYACLFTDLANPTSNSIYPKVGYRALGDARYVNVRPA